MGNIRKKAEDVFSWACEQEVREDPEFLAFVNHSRAAAEVMERVAEKAGMDTERAYASGLLHDVGRYRGMKMGMYHVIAGYKKMMEEGEPEIARICLTHSFYPKRKMDAFSQIGDLEEWKFLREYIRDAKYDDYDLLGVLADHMAGGHGVTTLERRFCSVLVRHGAKQPRADLVALLKLKKYFDQKTGMNIYELFREEIAETSIRSVAENFITVSEEDLLGEKMLVAEMSEAREKIRKGA